MTDQLPDLFTIDEDAFKREAADITTAIINGPDRGRGSAADRMRITSAHTHSDKYTQLVTLEAIRLATQYAGTTAPPAAVPALMRRVSALTYSLRVLNAHTEAHEQIKGTDQ